MRFIPCLGVLLFLAGPAAAHTSRDVEKTCPLDGHKFIARVDMSGTSFGARLDLKKLGPIAQPWSLPQCPQCRLPLYEREFSEELIAQLRPIVAGERFRRETEGRTSYFALGVLFEELGREPSAIAWCYLRASWQVENDYRLCAGRAITWFDLAVATPLAADADREAKDDRLIDAYLPIELCRRLGDFVAAGARLDTMPSLEGTEIEWLADVLAYQRRLIDARDTAPHAIGEAIPPVVKTTETSAPPPAPDGHAEPPASMPAPRRRHRPR